MAERLGEYFALNLTSRDPSLFIINVFLLLGVELLVLGMEPRALCMLDKFSTFYLNPQFPNTLKPLYPVTMVLWARVRNKSSDNCTAVRKAKKALSHYSC